MIHEQLEALGNVLKNVKRSKMVDLMNEIRYKKIYRYNNIEEDLKGKSIQWIIEATNHEKFSCLSPYYIIKGNTMYSFKYNDIDFADLAEYLFCRYSIWDKFPEMVQKVLDNNEVLECYKGDFVEYLMDKSGATKEQAEKYLNSIEGFRYLVDWFALYCDFVPTL